MNDPNPMPKWKAAGPDEWVADMKTYQRVRTLHIRRKGEGRWEWEVKCAGRVEVLATASAWYAASTSAAMVARAYNASDGDDLKRRLEPPH